MRSAYEITYYTVLNLLSPLIYFCIDTKLWPKNIHNKDTKEQKSGLKVRAVVNVRTTHKAGRLYN